MGGRESRRSVSRGFFSESFIRVFRGMFLPVSGTLKRCGVTPNTVTYLSFLMGIVTGTLFALDHLYLGFAAGMVMSLMDIIDGQLAKDFGGTTRFGGVLDSTVDRYNEFFLFAGLGYRYFVLGRPGWIVLCAFAFLGSVMVSYVKSRAEAAGFECKVGLLQRPERLTILGVALLFGSIGADAAVVILAIGTQMTVFSRLAHVWRQAKPAGDGRER